MATETLTDNQRMALAVLGTMTVGDRNRAILNAYGVGLSAKRIADAVGLSVSQVYRILGGSR